MSTSGFPPTRSVVKMDVPQDVKEIEPGAKWPRTKPEEFPKAIDVNGELPAWFPL